MRGANIIVFLPLYFISLFGLIMQVWHLTQDIVL